MSIHTKPAHCKACGQAFTAKRKGPSELWPEYCSLPCVRNQFKKSNILDIERKEPDRFGTAIPVREAAKLIR